MKRPRFLQQLLARPRLPTADEWRRWAPLIGLGALTIVSCFIYARVFRGEINGDDNTFHFAEAARMRDCLVVGDYDLWNPSSNSGFASGYYYQIVPQLGPAVGSWIFGGSILWWFQLGAFLPFVLAPAAAYRGLRLMEASPWEALGGALGVAFCLGESKWGFGPDGTFQVGLYTQGWATAVLPLALGHAVRWIDRGEHLGGAAFWGTLVGLCHPFIGIALGVALFAGQVWRSIAPYVIRRDDDEEPSPVGAWVRLVVLGGFLLVGSASAWAPVIIDYIGFGGFPHRVQGEDGMGIYNFLKYAGTGHLLDFQRAPIITLLVPVVAIFGRSRWLGRLWAATIVFSLFIALGPYFGTTDDDLFPMIRFLGALQVVVALAAVGGLAMIIVDARAALRGTRFELAGREVVGAALGLAVVVLAVSGTIQQRSRIMAASDFSGFYREELDQIFPHIAAATQGREQVRGGAEAHWSNLLPFVYAERPAMLQMGGAGLQASPNYVYLWEQTDVMRAAYIWDAPLVLLKRDQEHNVPGGTVLATTDHYELKEYPASGLVVPVQVMGELPEGRKAARAAGVKWLKGMMPLNDQVLAYAGSGIAGPPPQGIVIAYSRQMSPGDDPDLTAVVEASAPTTFEIKESWHPRWEGTLDGKPAVIRRVTPDYMAFDVPKGRHTIALRFHRPWWAWALWLLWPGVGLGGWIVTRYLKRRTGKDGGVTVQMPPEPVGEMPIDPVNSRSPGLPG